MAKNDINLKEEFVPYVSSNQAQMEVTARAVILGIIISVIFGIGNAYIGLKYGMTISASLPAAVISMAVLRSLFKKVSVLENNIVQTIGSAGESLAAGVVFTFPAFLIWEAQNAMGINEIFHLGGKEVVALALLGGALGIFLMIPLRRYLVHQEHGRLKFPEGTACAEIIVAGDQGGSKARTVFWGIGIGALYKVLMGGTKLWNEFPIRDLRFRPFDGGVIGLDATPILLGIGYIIGPRVAALMLSGAVLGYLGIAPVAKFLGLDYLWNLAAKQTSLNPEISNYLGTVAWQAKMAGMHAISQISIGMEYVFGGVLKEASVDTINSAFIRDKIIKYLGVGAVTVGGFVSLIKSFPTIISSFSRGFKQIIKRSEISEEKPHRTQQDLPMWVVLVGTLFVILALWAYPGTDINILAIALTIIFGFFFIVVAARIVGILGSSSSPVSGMTIATLLIASLILSAFGIAGAQGMITAMTVGAVVCIAVCMSGDIAQDLKTGYLLGATPRKMQLIEFAGLAASAITMGWILFLLGDTYGFIKTAEHPNPLLAPQANVMASVVQGILGGELPWVFIIGGGMIALAVEFLGISSLPFAIGLYLPLDLSTPIMTGGLLALMVRKVTRSTEKYKIRQQKGVLFGSGLVAGDAIVGVVIAILLSVSDKIQFLMPYKDFSDKYNAVPVLGATLGDIVSLGCFALLAFIFWQFTRLRKSER